MRFSSNTAPRHAAGFCSEIPASFTSIEEARNSLDYHATKCIHLFAAGGPHPNPEQLVVPRVYLAILDHWQSALQGFLHSAADSLSTTGKQAVRIMQLNRTFLAANIEVSTQADRLSEMLWDNYLPDFKRMTALAHEITEQADMDLRKDSRNLHKFQMDMNIIAPLYGIASRCRDPTIRREAVSLLLASRNQQGLWDSSITAQVCGKLVEIEEEGLGQITRCEDVPEWARVSGVKVSFDTEGRLGTIAYRRKPGPWELETQDFQEMFQILPDDINPSEGNVRIHERLDNIQIHERLETLSSDRIYIDPGRSAIRPSYPC